MIFKTFHEWSLAQLGMGNMRLPTVGSPTGPIDEPKARAIIEYAYEHGVNYFDTAYRYHNGQSEKFTGQVLRQYPRESWHLATKMPGHMMAYQDGQLQFVGYLAGLKVLSPAEIFEQQLANCGVDYFDVYLLHNVCETSLDLYMNEELGIVDYLLAQKQAGRIRHLGFSTHAGLAALQRFLDWRDCFDVVQMQLNYVDWTLQSAKAKYELLAARGIPVIAMEPCRGGRLASLGKEATALLKAARPNDSIASWAFRFVKSLPNVQVVLSGMSEISQAIDNVSTFSDPAALSEAEQAVLQQVVDSLVHLVPCTACRYCCEGCPASLDIPKLIALYNEMSFEQSASVHMALAAMGDAQGPANCIACGACRQVCPQGIDVPAVMAALTAAIAQVRRG